MTYTCSICNAKLWENEARVGNANLKLTAYSMCCGRGKVMLPDPPHPPRLILDLLTNNSQYSRTFIENIRSYNQMFSFTSMGGRIDTNINNRGRGPFVFRLNGQNHHSIGSLLPETGKPPKFCQLSIVDTKNEVANRKRAVRYINLCSIMIFTICSSSF